MKTIQRFQDSGSEWYYAFLSIGMKCMCCIVMLSMHHIACSQTFPRELIRFRMESTLNYDETVMYFQENATQGFDSKYDAYKMTNPRLNLYTNPVAGLNLAINAMNNHPGDVLIPLVFKSKEVGLHKLKITQHLNDGMFVDIFIHDIINNTSTRLDVGAVWEFYLDSTDLNIPLTDRFVIDIHERRSSIVTSDIVTLSNMSVDVFPNPLNDGGLTIKWNDNISSNVTIEVRGMAGRIVGTYQFTSVGNEIYVYQFDGLEKGVYYVDIAVNESVHWKKRIFKN